MCCILTLNLPINERFLSCVNKEFRGNESRTGRKRGRHLKYYICSQFQPPTGHLFSQEKLVVRAEFTLGTVRGPSGFTLRWGHSSPIKDVLSGTLNRQSQCG